MHGPSAVDKDNGYRVGFVEFDDQGWLNDLGQIDKLMKTLWAIPHNDADPQHSKKADPKLFVMVFVHGWKHNADVCDANVICFQDMLKVMSRKLGPNYLVFGIYVSWRGLSTRGNDLWENASFYDRKNTATHVALGSVRELFGRLKNFQENDARHRWLVIVGHSFGGLIVYNAVSQFLIERAAAYDDGRCQASCRLDG